MAPGQLPPSLTACWRPSQAPWGLMGLQVVSVDCWLEILVLGPSEGHPHFLRITSNKLNLRPANTRD